MQWWEGHQQTRNLHRQTVDDRHAVRLQVVSKHPNLVGAMMLGPQVLGVLRPPDGALRSPQDGAVLAAKEAKEGPVRALGLAASGVMRVLLGAAPTTLPGCQQALHVVAIELVFITTRGTMMYITVPMHRN